MWFRVIWTTSPYASGISRASCTLRPFLAVHRQTVHSNQTTRTAHVSTCSWIVYEPEATTQPYARFNGGARRARHVVDVAFAWLRELAPPETAELVC